MTIADRTSEVLEPSFVVAHQVNGQPLHLGPALGDTPPGIEDDASPRRHWRHASNGVYFGTRTGPIASPVVCPDARITIATKPPAATSATTNGSSTSARSAPSSHLPSRPSAMKVGDNSSRRDAGRRRGLTASFGTVRSVIRTSGASSRDRFVVAIGGLAVLSAALSLLLRAWLFDRGSLNADEVAYLLQGDAISHGELFLDVRQPARAYQPWFFVERWAGFVSKYLPLMSGFLALGILSGVGVAPIWRSSPQRCRSSSPPSHARWGCAGRTRSWRPPSSRCRRWC